MRNLGEIGSTISRPLLGGERETDDPRVLNPFGNRARRNYAGSDPRLKCVPPLPFLSLFPAPFLESASGLP